MRLVSLSSIVFFALLISCDTANNVEPTYENYFTKYYGADGEQEGVDIVLNGDGSMILLGNSSSQTTPVSPFIVKTDAIGNVLWQREFKTDNETAVDIELINGGSQVAVLSNVKQSTITNICLYILGQDGNLVDSVYFEKSVNQVAKSVSQLSDGGFLVTGYQDPAPERNPNLVSPPTDQADVMVLKIDNGLNTSTDLSPGGGEYVGSGVKTFEINFNSPYYLIFGWSDQPRPGRDDYKSCFQLFAATPQGSFTGLQGVSAYEAELQEASTVLKIPPALGDGYLVIGKTSLSPGGPSDLYLTRFNKPQSPDNIAKPTLDGKIPLGRRVEGISAANASPDGYFIVANEVRENNKKDIFLLRVERDGAVSWSNSFGSLEGEDTAGGVEALPDGRVAVVGTVQLETQKKIVLIVTGPNGRFSN